MQVHTPPETRESQAAGRPVPQIVEDFVKAAAYVRPEVASFPLRELRAESAISLTGNT